MSQTQIQLKYKKIENTVEDNKNEEQLQEPENNIINLLIEFNTLADNLIKGEIPIESIEENYERFIYLCFKVYTKSNFQVKIGEEGKELSRFDLIKKINEYFLLREELKSKNISKELSYIFLISMSPICKYYEETRKSMYYYNRNTNLWEVLTTEKLIFKKTKELMDEYIYILNKSYLQNILESVILNEEFSKSIEGIYKLLNRSKKILDKQIKNMRTEYCDKYLKLLDWAPDLLYDKEICEKINRKPVIPYNNEGKAYVVDLESGEIRERIKEDYVTYCYERSYIHEDKRNEKDVEKLMKYLRQITSCQKVNREEVIKICRRKCGIKGEKDKEGKIRYKDEEIPNTLIEEIEIELSKEKSEEMLECLLNVMGYFITPYTNEQSGYIFQGEASSSKSTFAKLHQKIFSYNTKNISAGVLLKGPKTSSSSATPELFDLKDTNLAIAEEVDQDSKIDVPKCLNLFGGGNMSCRNLNQGIIKFAILAKFLMIVNSIPLFPPTRNIIRRLKIFPFNAFFKELNYINLGDYKGIFLEDKIYQALEPYIEDTEELSEIVKKIMEMGSNRLREIKIREIMDNKVTDPKLGVYPVDKDFMDKFLTGGIGDIYFSIIIDRAINYAKNKSIYYPDIIKETTSNVIENMKEDNMMERFIKERCRIFSRDEKVERKEKESLEDWRSRFSTRLRKFHDELTSFYKENNRKKDWKVNDVQNFLEKYNVGLESPINPIKKIKTNGNEYYEWIIIDDNKKLSSLGILRFNDNNNNKPNKVKEKEVELPKIERNIVEQQKVYKELIENTNNQSLLEQIDDIAKI
jgi:hypothetical protein